MGTRLLSEFQTDLNSATGRSLSAADSKRYINDAIREVAYAFKFHELESTTTFVTVAGTASYAHAADFRVLKESGIEITLPSANISRLIPETRSRYLRNRLDVTVTTNRGVPTFYHKYGAQLFLRPIPDIVYTLQYDYWKKITALSAAGDVSPLNEDWDEIIFLGALYRAFRDYNEHDRFINIYNNYLGMVRSRSEDEDLEEFPVGGLNIIRDEADIIGLDG